MTPENKFLASFNQILVLIYKLWWKSLGHPPLKINHVPLGIDMGCRHHLREIDQSGFTPLVNEYIKLIVVTVYQSMCSQPHYELH